MRSAVALFLWLAVLAPTATFAARQPEIVAATVRRPRTIDAVIFRPGDPHFELFPLTNYVNTAFDTAQVSLAFGQDGYWRNHERVLNVIADPHHNIKKDGGYGKFFHQEFASSHVLPNLTLHLLGNGFDFRTLAEWYDYHQVRFPYVWAFVTSYAGYLGNEAIESSNPKVDALDHIADLYIFNLIGNLLYTSDTVTNLVYHRLQMRNWTGQPILDLRHGKLLNASNNYVVRPKLWGENVRPFVYLGLHYFGGLAFGLSNRTTLSLGVGLAATDPLREGNSFTDNLEKIQPSGGVFWDRDDQLLGSVIFNSTDALRVRANLYPALFRRKILDLGFFLGLSDDGTPAFGMTMRKVLAVGFR